MDRSSPSDREAYRVLGLDPGANQRAIRDAYRRKVKDVHPDADGGDEEEFKRVAAAYETLRQ
jgi:curved DNA-binding protein CbpA